MPGLDQLLHDGGVQQSGLGQRFRVAELARRITGEQVERPRLELRPGVHDVGAHLGDGVAVVEPADQSRAVGQPNLHTETRAKQKPRGTERPNAG